MLQSAELDYNEDPNLADTAPPYTHAFQGPDSNELPPLMGGAYEGSGLVGEEAFDLQQQQPGAIQAAGAGGALVQQQQQLLQVLPADAAEDDEDDQYRNQEIPPGVYDYEAGVWGLQLRCSSGSAACSGSQAQIPPLLCMPFLRRQ